MSFSEGYVFITEYEVRLDEYIISGSSGLEVVETSQFLSILKGLTNLPNLIFPQRLIEEHRYTTPDNREGIFYDPEGNPNRKYCICPPPTKKLHSEESYQDSAIHHEI